MQFSKSLQANIKLFSSRFAGDTTFITRQIESVGTPAIKCCIIYCDGMVNNQIVNENIITPITRFALPAPQADILQAITLRVLQINELKKSSDVDEIIRAIVYGDTLFLCEGCGEGLILNTKGFQMRSISEPEGEQVLQGPREGFTEGILTNISLLRRKLRTSSLKFQFSQMGECTKTSICLCFIDGVVDKRVLAEVRRRLEGIKIDGILDSNYVQEFLRDAPYSPFKTIGSSERPDTVAAKLLEGRVAIIVDGSPVVLTAPYIFIEQFQSSEDYYVGFLYAAVSRFVRVLGFLFSISVIPIYISLITYHPEMLPTSLLLSITAAREAVPFPTIVEALGLLLAFEILRESGARTPSSIGTTLSIVGALVLGQAAVEARFVSAPMVIIVAFAGITGLMLPKIKSAIVATRAILAILAAAMGLYGYVFGMIIILAHLSRLKSFGVDCLRDAQVFSGSRNEDSYFRMPWKKMKRAGRFIAKDVPK